MNGLMSNSRRTGSDLAAGAVAAVRWPVFSVTSFRMVRDLKRLGIAPELVVDVGANRGQFTTAVLELLPGASVVAIEPLPDAAEHLRQLKGRWPGRLDVVEAAAGAAAGQAELTVNAHSQSSSLLTLDSRHTRAFPDAIPVGTVTVEVAPLDEILRDRDVPPTALLKIDAQGSERDVLAGAATQLSSFRNLLVEASFDPLYQGEWTFSDVLDFARANGLRFMRPVGALRDPRTGAYLQIDALFEAL
jgi:FkbM family methyltransferase